MFMNNCVHLLGRLGRAPEIRTANSGDRVATLNVVTSDVYKDKQSGEWVEKPEWHRITIWGEGSIKHVEKLGVPGAQIAVMGQLRTRKWVGPDGEDRYSTEVVADFRAGGQLTITPKPDMTETRESEPGEAHAKTSGRRKGQRQAAAATQSFSADLDDEIPF